MMTTGMIKRAEIRKHLRIQQQLKVGTLVLMAILLLAAYPVYLFTRGVAQDPVFSDLDALDLPTWATMMHEDAASGSRWCIEHCRFRHRTWASERKPDETNAAYAVALNDAGWRPYAGDCTPYDEGIASCWQRDEYVMEMWVREPICDVPPPRPSITGVAPAEGVTPGPEQSAPAVCPGALVTVEVSNAIS
jgi:integrin beta 3